MSIDGSSYGVISPTNYCILASLEAVTAHSTIIKTQQDTSQRLDQVIDSENSGVPKHLGKIASSVYEWEGRVADELGLTDAEVADIKQESKLNLQVYAI